MSGDPATPLGNLLILLVVGLWLLRRSGLFHGFATGFWSGFWTRIFVGTLRSPTGSGCLEPAIKIAALIAFIAFLIACLGAVR